ncbi:hypothetical protein ACOMHN_009475 [Nucella lapillus]
MDNCQDGAFCGEDGRGKQTPVNKTSGEDRRRVKRHVESFPAMESHYCRRNCSKRFLDATLNVNRMYRMYSDQCAEDGVIPVSNSMYRTIFDEDYNLAFHKPKKDQCLLCYQYEDAKQNGTLTETLGKEYDEHQKRKQDGREEKERDKTLAMENVELETMTFDLQAVLSTPCNNVSQTHYKRKLAVYNLTVYSLASKEGKCFVWDETEGNKGSCEIATCLVRHLESLPQQVKHAVLYSDTCSGQNRNKFLAVGLLYAAQHLPHIQKIDQKFLESGHTHMECDSMHSTIESAKTGVKVHTPDEWTFLMRCARPRKRYDVEELAHRNIFDFKSVATTCLRNTKSDTDGNRVNWMKIKWLRYLKGEEDTIYFKYKMSDPFKKLKIRHGSSRRGRPISVTTIEELPRRYAQRLPISAAKKADLMDLCRLRIIPPTHHLFYKNLPSDCQAQDRLPDPDATEDTDTDTD